MRPNAWYPARQWRDEATRAMDAHLVRAAERQHPNPPPERFLRVRALTANWRMDGEAVTVGETYRVSENEAHRLVLTGKGELA